MQTQLIRMLKEGHRAAQSLSMRVGELSEGSGDLLWADRMGCPHAGVLTTDPRIVSEARPVPLLTYEEASELAFFGATVLHPSAMQPALQTSNLDVRVKNSYNRCGPILRLLQQSLHLL